MELKRLIRSVFAGALAFGATAAADVVVHIGPPHVVVETRPRPPSHNHVWVQGYHNYDGRGYVWVPGR